MATFGGYTRVSDVGNRGDRLLSPQFQEEQIRGWATSAGHEVVMLPAELDESGGRDDRPILLDAIEQVESGQLDGIAVAKLDRLSRSLAGSIRIIERIEAADGEVRSVAEQLDVSTPEGRLTRNMLFSIAQLEREVKAEGLAHAREDAIARGIHISGRPPFGYRRRKDRVLEPDPETAPIVREMFRRRASGDSWRTIADYVAGEVGRPYAPQSIARMVSNRTYLGVARHGEFVSTDAHEPLVDRATFEAAQIKHPRPPRGKTPALLSGLIVCAGCGRPMVPTTRSGVRAYRCRRLHQRGECEAPAHVGEWVEEQVTRTVADVMRGRRYTPARATRAVEAAEKALREAEGARDDFAAATAGMAREDIAAGMQAHAEKVRNARRLVAEARQTVGDVPDPRSWDRIWKEADPVARQRLLRSALGAVVVRKGSGVDPDRVRILAPGFTVTPDEPVDFDQLPDEAVVR